MEERLDPKYQAKKMVNAIYQPMGHLRCHISSDEMWEWAKARVSEQLDLIISEIPMYQGELNPKWKYYDAVRSELKELP